jgi:hypothetical protein
MYTYDDLLVLILKLGVTLSQEAFLVDHLEKHPEILIPPVFPLYSLQQCDAPSHEQQLGGVR